MLKNKLMNGDIVVLRGGQVAVVIGEGSESYLVFQNGGFEFLDDYYSDDLIYGENEDAVMQVFRSNAGLGFESIDEEEPIYERDDTWVRPVETVRKQENAVVMPEAKSEKKKLCVIAQAFYGNRTAVTIQEDELDRFLLGYPDSTVPVKEPIDRTIVRLPGSDALVLVYNKLQEAEQRKRNELLFSEESYSAKPLAVIPESGLEIYSRCIVCRMNEQGVFESLEKEDFEVWKQYLAR